MLWSGIIDIILMESVSLWMGDLSHVSSVYVETKVVVDRI